MSTQTVQSAGTAAMPRVNLMPPEIAEAERLRKLQLAMVGAVAASIAVVGLLYFHEKSGVDSAKQNLATAQAQQASYQEKLASLQAVAQTFAEVQAKQALLNQALGQQIRWSYVLNDLSFKLPSNLWLNSLTATESSAGGSSTTTPSPTSLAAAGTVGAPIGSLAFTVTGRKHDDVAAWLDSLARIRGFADPAFQSSTESSIGTTPVVNASTTVSLTPAALNANANANPTTTTGSGS